MQINCPKLIDPINSATEPYKLPEIVLAALFLGTGLVFCKNISIPSLNTSYSDTAPLTLCEAGHGFYKPAISGSDRKKFASDCTK